jgi:sugar porter (SP) family MFS transporter
MGMSGSFGSSLFLVEEGDESLLVSLATRKRFKPPADVENEHSPLNGGAAADESPTFNGTLFTTILTVTIGSSLQFGYATGVMNNSQQIIMDYFHNQGKEYDIMQWGTTVSCYGVGGLIGSVLGPKVIGEFCGRRATLLVNNLFLVISSYLIMFAPVWWWQAIGRIFVGITAGVATAVVPTYFSEISPIQVRGAVGTMHQLGITVGILLSQALSTPSLNLLGSDQLWKWLFVVPVVCGLIEMMILPFCPESPSYLYITKGEKEARDALIRLQSNAVADKYLGYIKEEVKVGVTGQGEMGVLELFCDKRLRKHLIVGITVQLMMQFSGIDAVFYYSTRVFYQADVKDPELATTCLGIINVIVTIFAVKWMDTAGRKTLLTYSWIGMCMSYMLLTLSFILKPHFNFMDQVRPHCDAFICCSAGVGLIIYHPIRFPLHL